MNDADHSKERFITAERLLASLLVLLWIGLVAWKLDGLVSAFRAFLLFMMPLAMIWLPQLFARIALRDEKWQRDFSPPPSALVVRVFSWLIILGVPLAWFVFGRIGKG